MSRAGTPGPRAPRRPADEIAADLENLVRSVDLKLQKIFGQRMRFGLVIDHGDRVTTISTKDDTPVIGRVIKRAADDV